MLNGFGWPHLLIIAVLIILLFGAKRLPDAARGLGRSMRIFKSEVRGLHDDDVNNAPPAPPMPQQQLIQPQPAPTIAEQTQSTTQTPTNPEQR